MNNIRSIIERVSLFLTSMCTGTCAKEYVHDLKVYFNMALEERTKVILEYVKQVNLISHDTICTQIQTTEQHISETIAKVEGKDQQTMSQMKQLQDNMDTIVRTVNITETKIASLSVHIEALRKSISETIDEVHTHKSRRYR